MAVQKNYGVPPPSPEYHHEVIEYIETKVQVMQTQIYDLEGMAQANKVLISPNPAVLALLELLTHMTLTINAMQLQLNMLTLAPMNQTRSKRNYYCWIGGSNYTHGSKTYSSKNMAIKMRPTIRRDWTEAIKGAHEGQG